MSAIDEEEKMYFIFFWKDLFSLFLKKEMEIMADFCFVLMEYGQKKNIFMGTQTYSCIMPSTCVCVCYKIFMQFPKEIIFSFF
jgi:hypothetical protein